MPHQFLPHLHRSTRLSAVSRLRSPGSHSAACAFPENPSRNNGTPTHPVRARASSTSDFHIDTVSEPARVDLLSGYGHKWPIPGALTRTSIASAHNAIYPGNVAISFPASSGARSMIANPEERMIRLTSGKEWPVILEAERGVVYGFCWSKLTRMIRLLKAEWCFLFGRALSKWGRYKASVSQLERGLALNPKDLSALCLLGWCYCHLHEYQRALEAFDRALQVSTDCAYARLNIGEALFSLERYREAADSISRALRMEPKYGEKARYLKFLGLAYAQLGQNQEACENLRKADQLCPDDAETIYWLGRILNSFKRYEQAEEYLRRAAALEPDNYHAHGDRGLALYALEKWNESAAEYEQAIRLQPEWADGHIGLGKACRQLTDYTRSISAIKQAINLQPDNPDHYLQLGVSYGEAGRWEEKLEADRKLVQLRPDDAMSYLALSASYHALEQYQESADTCREALKINPGCVPALEGMGYAYLNLDRFEDAADALRQAISIKPDTPYTHAWLAHAHAGLNDEKAAREEISALVKLDTAMAKEIEPLVEDKLRASLPQY